MMKPALEWLEDQDELGDLALFLDFDGTLAPIVERPGDARPLDGVTGLVDRIGGQIPVAIISGRGLDDVTKRLGAEGIYYAGSHGLEIQDPDGERHESDDVKAALPDLAEQEAWLRQKFADDEEIEIERKRFGVAVHFRRRPEAKSMVEEAVQVAVERAAALKVSTGKMVREVQPDVERDKGTALRYIRERIDPENQCRPIYIGDDTTDEDAFEEIKEDGIGILVSEKERPTAAQLRLDEPEQVRRFLKRLAQKLESDENF